MTTLRQNQVARTCGMGIMLALALALSACDEGSSRSPDGGGNPKGTAAGADRVKDQAVAERIALPHVDQRLCTAVAILVDTSGSMAQPVRDAAGRERPKHQIARDALRRIVDYSADWLPKHPDRVLQLGLYNFSSSSSPVLAMDVFDAPKAGQAIDRLPAPAGGTAIGTALQSGFEALYASGCVRKYVICITDGENTSGEPPDRMARRLFEQTGGEVEIHFIAFDVAAEQFAFLKKVNGFVAGAADGAQLQDRLADIYEKRILAEAMAEGP